MRIYWVTDFLEDCQNKLPSDDGHIVYREDGENTLSLRNDVWVFESYLSSLRLQICIKKSYN